MRSHTATGWTQSDDSPPSDRIAPAALELRGASEGLAQGELCAQALRRGQGGEAGEQSLDGVAAQIGWARATASS
jgi:hypothetical protein